MLRKFLRMIQTLIATILLFPSIVFADQQIIDGGSASLGDISQNMLGPLSYLSQAVNYLCWIGGMALVLSGFIQYMNHRKNPTQVRLSKPILLWISGLVLIALPFIGKLTGISFIPT